MRNNPFGNVCLVAIICLLAVIAVKLDTVHAYAAKSWKYEVIPLWEGTADNNVTVQVAKQTQAGWELVAAPMWQINAPNPAQGFLIFRK